MRELRFQFEPRSIERGRTRVDAIASSYWDEGMRYESQWWTTWPCAEMLVEVLELDG